MRQHIALINLYLIEPGSTDGHIGFEATHIPHSGKWHCLHIFHQREFLRELAFGFELAQAISRINEAIEEGFARGARTNNISRDAIDARIEEIEREIHAVNRIVAGEFQKNIAHIIAKENDVIRVPANGAARMDEQLVVKCKMCRELVGD